MTPMLILALIISLVSVYFNGWVVPYANQHKSYIKQTYLQRDYETTAKSNIYVQDGPRRIVYLSYFDRTASAGGRASVQEFSDSNLISIKRRADGREIHWDSTSGKWTMLGATVRDFTSGKENIQILDRFTIDSLHFVPADIIKKEEKPDEMDFFRPAGVFFHRTAETNRKRNCPLASRLL